MLSYGKMLIQPGQSVDGGHLEYGLDTEKGAVTYSGEANVKILFVSTTFPLNGVSKVDPKFLLSANIKEKMEFKFANLNVKITKIGANKFANADVQVEVAGKQFHGTAGFDLSGEAIKLFALSCDGAYYGIPFQLRAVAA